MELFKIVLCSLCFSFAYCGTGTYKAAVIENTIVSNENKLVSMIHNAGELDVDILMLPEISSSNDNIQKVKETISNAAKVANIYVAVQTVEKSSKESTRNNLIFDRNGTIIRIPDSSRDITSEMETFASDFGVTFGVVMEEDLLKIQHLEEIKNVIAFGPSISETGFPYAKQFPGAWSFTTKSNLITASGVYGGRTIKSAGLIVAEMRSDLPDCFIIEPVKSFFPEEDMSQYTSEPLSVMSDRGYKKTICHDNFCCKFDVKTKTVGTELPYSLVAYSGVHDLGTSAIGVQTCAVVACVGHHDNCYTESENNKTSVFEKISISAHFSQNSVQYPLIISSTEVSYDDFKFDVQRNGSNYATVELMAKDIISFGIFGRDVSEDLMMNKADVNLDLADVVVENFQEFFDYVWIRLRVVIFILSIYILEML